MHREGYWFRWTETYTPAAAARVAAGQSVKNAPTKGYLMVEVRSPDCCSDCDRPTDCLMYV